MLTMHEFRDTVNGRCNPRCQHRKKEKRWHDHVLSQRDTSLLRSLINCRGPSRWVWTLHGILFRGIACYSRFWGESWFSPGIRFDGRDTAGGIARGQSDMVVIA
jgi:hypothetical protein